MLNATTMHCLDCSDKQCRKEGKDCSGTKDIIRQVYRTDGKKEMLRNADAVASGAYGALSRIQEIARLSKLQGWDTIGIAYCASFEKIARRAADHLAAEGLKIESCRCTVNGMKGIEVDAALPDAVSCNPIGQAKALNDSNCQFVIEMGLCLGHDIIFHQHIKKPFTVLAVKDRVYRHNPLEFIDGSKKASPGASAEKKE